MKQPADTPEFSRQEERANIALHAMGVLFGLIAIPFLCIPALTRPTGHFTAILIYAVSFLMLFTSSALYHTVRRYRLKMLCKKADRISIYFLIAGTYTAIIRYYLFDTTGMILLAILWSLVLAGIFFEILFPDKYGSLSVTFYLLMGLIFLTVPRHFFSSMSAGTVALILAGVFLYCLGVIFYRWNRLRFNHAIWHFCVLAGGILHFIAILHTVA